MVASDWLNYPKLAITFKPQNTDVAMDSAQTASAVFAYCST